MELLEQTIKEIKAIDTMYLDKKEVLKRLSLIKKELNKRSEQLPTLKDIRKLEIGETIFKNENIKVTKR